MHLYCYAPDPSADPGPVVAQPVPPGPEYDPSSPLYDPTLPPPPPACAPVAAAPPEAAWEAAPLPAEGTVFADPDARGLTGLESRFWWDGPGSVSWTQRGSAGVAADCSVVEAPVRRYSAWVVRLEWNLGTDVDPATGVVHPILLASDRPGDALDPAVRHVYESKDPRRTVSVQAVWASSDPAMGEIRIPAGSKPHPTVEARAVLTR